MGASSEQDASTHLLSGGFAGFFATALLHPLDLIKTRLHVQEQAVNGTMRRLPYYHGLWDACRSIMRLEGKSGFYAGLAPNVIGNTASWSVYMYTYNRCKASLGKFHIQGTQLYLTAATASGVLTTLLLHPVFTVKTRLQLQLHVAAASDSAQLPRGLVPISRRDNYVGMINAVRRMVAEEGLLSLYRGLGPSLLLVSHGSIQFLVYEHAKLHLARAPSVHRAEAYDQYGHLIQRRPEAAESDASRERSSSGGAPNLGAYELLLASTGSKVCATLATYPYQVVRSCMQQRAIVGGDAVLYNKSTSEVVKHIWRMDRLAGFYRGLWTHMLRSTPQATITLLVYEYCQRAFKLIGM